MNDERVIQFSYNPNEILEYFERANRVTSKDLENRFGYNELAVATILSHLTTEALIERDGGFRGFQDEKSGPRVLRTYKLTPWGRESMKRNMGGVR